MFISLAICVLVTSRVVSVDDKYIVTLYLTLIEAIKRDNVDKEYK